MTERDLTSFSYLTAEDVLKNHANMIVGVVNDGASILNDFGDYTPGFQVKRVHQCKVVQEDDNYYSDFHVNLDKEDSPSNPIVIASPAWYTNGQSRYPLDIAHVSLAVYKDSGEKNFTISAGTSSFTSRNLGFNFLAINPDYKDENIMFGFVMNDGETRHDQWTANFVEKPNPESSDLGTYDGEELCRELLTQNDGNDECRGCNELNRTKCDDVIIAEYGYGGVRITFDTPFDAIPSVIVTPVIEQSDCDIHWNTSFQVPHCIVETIQETGILVKCGLYGFPFDDGFDNPRTMLFRPLAFNFIAVSVPILELDNDLLQCNENRATPTSYE